MRGPLRVCLAWLEPGDVETVGKALAERAYHAALRSDIVRRIEIMDRRRCRNPLPYIADEINAHDRAERQCGHDIAECHRDQDGRLLRYERELLLRRTGPIAHAEADPPSDPYRQSNQEQQAPADHFPIEPHQRAAGQIRFEAHVTEASAR